LERLLERIFTGNGYAEVRAIGNNENDKPLRYFYNDPKELIDSLHKHQDKNLWIGMYKRKCRYKKEYLHTNQIWLDFDIGEIEKRLEGKAHQNALKKLRIKIEASFNEFKIPQPSATVFSGNGYHFYWFLKEAATDTQDLLKSLAILLGADPKATDNARVMRVPESINIKYGKNRKCELLDINEALIYDISTFEKIVNVKANQKPQKELEKLYETEKPCINMMLNGVEQGYRNFALFRIMADLQDKAFSCEQVRSILYDWNKRNNPRIDNAEFTRAFSYYWTGLKNGTHFVTCKPQNPETGTKLSKYCIFEECKSYHQNDDLYDLEHTPVLQINNRYINDLRDIKGNQLIVLLFLCAEKESSFTIEELISKTNMTKKTLTSHIGKLLSKGYIVELKKPKRNGKGTEYKYKSAGTFGLGRTQISQMALYRAIGKEISPSVFKVYVYLCKCAYSIAGGRKDAYPSQVHIAKTLKTSQATVSRFIAELEDKNFIVKKQNYKENGVEYLSYKIL
jgi:DNA-binding MarR family transcriptional regulator